MAPTATLNITLAFFGLSNLIQNPTVTPADRYYWLLGMDFAALILWVNLILLAYVAYRLRLLLRLMEDYNLELDSMARCFLRKDEMEVLKRYQLGEVYTKEDYYGKGDEDMEKGYSDPLINFPDDESIRGSEEGLHLIQPALRSAAPFTSGNGDPLNNDDTIHEEQEKTFRLPLHNLKSTHILSPATTITTYNSTLTYPNGTAYPITLITSSFIHLSDIIHNPTLTPNDKTFWVFGILYSVILTMIDVLFYGYLFYHWLRNRKNAANAWDDDDERGLWQWGMSLNCGIRFWRRRGARRIHYQPREERCMLCEEEEAVDEDEDKGHWLAGRGGGSARNRFNGRVVTIGQPHATVTGGFGGDDGEDVGYESEDGETVELRSVGSSESLETLV
ncbi:MAG: hypothetical protein Q9181_007825 [Wetmoreana brouardii]